MLMKSLVLYTAKIAEMKDFYTRVLGCPVITNQNGEFSVKIGETALVFRAAEQSAPFYHFAINIPENQFLQAKEWAKSKVPLNSEEGEEEVFFGSWNAHALYFEDPAGNIVELIARHNLKNASQGPFTPSSFLNISEIGIVVDKVIPFARRLNGLGFPNWKEDSEGLTPVGDETGLFITVKSGRKWFFTNKYAEFFPLEAEIEGFGWLGFAKADERVEIQGKFEVHI